MCIPTCFEIAWAGAGEQEGCPCGYRLPAAPLRRAFLSLMQNLARVFTRFRGKKRVGVKRPVSAAPRTGGRGTDPFPEAGLLPGEGNRGSQSGTRPGPAACLPRARHKDGRQEKELRSGSVGTEWRLLWPGPERCVGTHFWFPSLIVTLQSYPAPFHAWGNRSVIYTAS